MQQQDPVLAIRNFSLDYQTFLGGVNALNSVDLDIFKGEILGLVGESGCGKSSLAMSIIGLLPAIHAKISGESKIDFRGQDLLTLKESEMEKIRGTGISMIFQEPLTSLNPIFTVGYQLSESVKIGLQRKEPKSASVVTDKKSLKEQAVAWLRKVGIADSGKVFERYPHELSGGMRQRVMIAMALAARPALLLADEPTTALDVTTQAQILRLIRSLVNEIRTSVIFISHDLAVIAQIADRVAVMYAGIIVEEASVYEIFEKPLHPYTQALLASFPSDEKEKKRFETIPGSVPSLMNRPPGCPFHPRCKFAMKVCSGERPQLKEFSPGHKVACVLY